MLQRVYCTGITFIKVIRFFSFDNSQDEINNCVKINFIGSFFNAILDFALLVVVFSFDHTG